MEQNQYTLQENIQKLINSEVDDNTRQELLSQIKDVPEGDAELDFSRSLALALRHQNTLAAAAAIRQVINDEGYPPSSLPNMRLWLLAGGLLLMTLLFSTVFLWNRPDSKQNTLQERIEPLENVFFLADAGQGISNLQQGMAAYDAGQYTEAERFLQAYVVSNPDYAANLYLGIARLLSGKTTKAIAPLSEAAQSPEPPVKEAAQWYLALAHLNSGQSETAKSILLGIPQESMFADQAKRVLEKIK